MNDIKFRIAAKTDVGLVRNNNEDNFQASSDLSGEQMKWVNNEICTLGDKGALIVVADGMGGMNAGEVASELVIETVREYFSSEKLTPDILKNRFSIEKYMNDTIVAADMRIKAEAKVRPETKGMGTTIVIGWILDGKLYISWCGDSRAYIYNPLAGLHQISKDHSYVQTLVDKGSITKDEAFDFPDSNIITRCLSDGTAKAKPESLLKPYEICDNDIIMLCTDGLSGMIRDSEIESVMRHNECNMDALVDELIKAACEAEGSDNITICLCQILQGGSSCNPAIFIDYDKRLNGNGNGNKNQTSTTIVNSSKEDTSKSKLIWLIGITCVIIAILSVAIWWFTYRKSQSVNGVNDNQTGQVHTEEPTYDDAKANNAIKTEPDVNTTDVSVREDKAKTTNNATGTIFQKTASTKTAEKTDAEEDDTDLTPIPNSDEQETPTAEVPQTETHKYKVLKGDSYYSIAKKFNIDVDVLKRLNNNIDLKAGATIKLPK